VLVSVSRWPSSADGRLPGHRGATTGKSPGLRRRFPFPRPLGAPVLHGHPERLYRKKKQKVTFPARRPTCWPAAGNDWGGPTLWDPAGGTERPVAHDRTGRPASLVDDAFTSSPLRPGARTAVDARPPRENPPVVGTQEARRAAWPNTLAGPRGTCSAARSRSARPGAELLAQRPPTERLRPVWAVPRRRPSPAGHPARARPSGIGRLYGGPSLGRATLSRHRYPDGLGPPFGLPPTRGRYKADAPVPAAQFLARDRPLCRFEPGRTIRRLTPAPGNLIARLPR